MPADSLFNNFMINYFGIIVNRLRINFDVFCVQN